jgi:L-threonylcarbamoyladenylate synthase
VERRRTGGAPAFTVMTDDELERAVDALTAGTVVAAATETFFGLLADARRSSAVDLVFSLKGREASKGVALLLPSRDAWAPLVASIPPLAAQLADRFWPGPLSVALAARPGIDARLTEQGTVAVRWAGASDASRVAAAFGAPLTATSANRAGRPPAESADEVRRQFPDAVVAGNLLVLSGHAPGGAPSTLVRVDEGRVWVLRRGQIPESELAGVVPDAALG